LPSNQLDYENAETLLSMKQTLLLFALGAILAPTFEANADSTRTNLMTRVRSESSVKSVPNVVLGRVTDQAGTPLGQVRWRISAVEKWQDGQWTLPPLTYLPRSDQPEFVTDSEGRFELKFPEKARYDLQFDKDGYAPVFLYQVGSDAGELHVVMKEGVAVRGSIVRMDGTRLTGTAPLVVKLRFPSRDVWFQTSTHVDAQGWFEFPHVSPPAKAPFWKETPQWQIVCLGKGVRIDVVEGKPVDVRVEISQADIERDFQWEGMRKP
jgi:hypothetical protein